MIINSTLFHVNTYAFYRHEKITAIELVQNGGALNCKLHVYYNSLTENVSN